MDIKKLDELKPCPFCGEKECMNEMIEVVDDHEAVVTEVIRCGYCGVTFIMDGEDFNTRKDISLLEAVKGEIANREKVLTGLGYIYGEFGKGVTTTIQDVKNIIQSLINEGKKEGKDEKH